MKLMMQMHSDANQPYNCIFFEELHSVTSLQNIGSILQQVARKARNLNIQGTF